jgi:hypothetical protein
VDQFATVNNLVSVSQRVAVHAKALFGIPT